MCPVFASFPENMGNKGGLSCLDGSQGACSVGGGDTAKGSHGFKQELGKGVEKVIQSEAERKVLKNPANLIMCDQRGTTRAMAVGLEEFIHSSNRHPWRTH